MATPEQELFETQKVMKFLNLLGADKAHLKKNPEPEPDFSFSLGGSKIGLEETQIYFRDNDFVRQQFAGNCELITKEAEKLFELHDVSLMVHISFKDISGTVNFDKDSLLNMRDKKELPKQIAELVTLYHPKNPGETIDIIHDEPYPENIMSMKIDEVSITNTTGICPPVWAPTYAGIVPTLNIELLNQNIKRKDNRRENYKADYNEIWLLLTINEFMYSSYFKLDDAISSYKFASNFDRVFLYDVGANTFKQLNLN